jgi:pyruvyl transferase EpsO
MAPQDRATLAELRGQIDGALDAVIPAGRPVALLHYPYDGNVGNHMMWVATTDYLAERGIPVGFVAHANNCDPPALRRAIGSGPVLLLGGVTLSRLWPHIGKVTRLVAAGFPDNPIVSLPATCLFVDEEDRRVSGKAFGDHPRVTVMTREARSTEQARGAFPSNVQVVTVPDVALRLPPQPRRTEPRLDIIWLARVDPEATGVAPPADVKVFDWPGYPRSIPGVYYRLRASGVLSHVRSSRLGRVAGKAADALMVGLYRSASEAALRHGNAILDEGRVLVTDRMHPHILAALRGQDVVLLPERFGKNRAIFDAGTGRLSRVHWAETPAEALELARALADRSRRAGGAGHG